MYRSASLGRRSGARAFVRALSAALLALSLTASVARADMKTWYLAEGATGLFEEIILLGNPNAAPANVTITYLLPAGQAGPVKHLVVGATSRATVRVNDDVPASAVSAIVTADQDIVVERSMYWGGADHNGLERRRLGGHNSAGVLSPAAEWYFAEGVSNAIFDEFILLVNPSASPTIVEISYLGTDGVADVDRYRVEANSRRTVWVRADLDKPFNGRFRNRTFSAIVRSTDGAKIIAERSIYWGGLGLRGFDPGGTNAVGVTATSTIWRFAEGFTGAGFNTFLLIENPTTTDATVDVTFYFEDGTTTVEPRTVKALARITVWVNAEVRQAQERPFSMTVSSTNGVGVVAERAMYWGDLREGHVVTGLTSEASKWVFAEGVQGSHEEYGYDSYFLLVNTTDTEATVRALFYLEDGRAVRKVVRVAPKSRFTLATSRLAPLVGKRFAASFESTSGTPILAERAVYWGPRYQGGHASAGTVWSGGLPVPSVVIDLDAAP